MYITRGQLPDSGVARGRDRIPLFWKRLPSEPTVNRMIREQAFAVPDIEASYPDGLKFPDHLSRGRASR